MSQTLFVTEKATTLFRSIDDLFADFSAKRGWWITGNWGDTLMTAMYPPNMVEKVGIGAGDTHAYAASSQHPGRVNALFGDGSVRFIKDSIQTWPYDTLTGTPVGATKTPAAGG